MSICMGHNRNWLYIVDEAAKLYVQQCNISFGHKCDVEHTRLPTSSMIFKIETVRVQRCDDDSTANDNTTERQDDNNVIL
jgi:hypothetical protein